MLSECPLTLPMARPPRLARWRLPPSPIRRACRRLATPGFAATANLPEWLQWLPFMVGQLQHGQPLFMVLYGALIIDPKEPRAPAQELVMVMNGYDTDGDGAMEVVVHSAYYEGGSTSVYRCTASKIVEVLSVGCGA